MSEQEQAGTVLKVGAPRPAPAIPDLDEPQRTDPRSFAVQGIAALTQLAIPMVIGALAILDDDSDAPIGIIAGVMLAIVLLNFAFTWLRWYRFTYTVGANDIRVESGLVSRAARSVPYERIQDVSLEQKIVPRVFGLVQVRFETGAGGKDELSLAYLSEAEGERLRELVRSQKAGESPAQAEDGAEAPAEATGELLFAMGPKRVFTFGLFEFSLAILAVLGGLIQQFDFLIPFDIFDDDFWRAQAAGTSRWVAAWGIGAQAFAVIAGVVSLLVLGMVTGIIRTTLREWDFRLERTDKGLRRRRGLLTRTDVVMPVNRVQALRIGTGRVRRFFGWHSLSVVSLAQDSGNANHDAAPFAQMEEIAPIVATTGFHLPGADAAWQLGAKNYRIDRVILAAALLVPAAVTLAVFVKAWLGVLPLLALAWIAAVEAYNWRFAANLVDDTQIYVRRSWLAPAMSISSREKLQSVEIGQGPIARRRGYATLSLGLAGGKFRMFGIPLERAQALRASVLASMQRRDFSEIV